MVRSLTVRAFRGLSVAAEGFYLYEVKAYLLHILDAFASSIALQYESEHGERPLSDPGDHIGHLNQIETTLHELTLDVSWNKGRAEAFKNEFRRPCVVSIVDVVGS